MGEKAELSGPDLEKDGIPTSVLGEGRPVLGHALGEAVLLVRRGDDVRAIGATCTHYGGPLAEGLVVGEEVHCPWHHACFDLRTGAAVGAPALNPVACFETAKRGEKLFVLGKVERKPQARPAVSPVSDGASAHRAAWPTAVVVVGAGAAGICAAEALRAGGYEGKVTLIGREPSVPYDRPNLSKDYLAGNAPEEWIPLRGPESYEEKKIDLRLEAEVTSLDPAKKEIALAGGDKISFGALILATGASPVKPPIPGADAGVHYLRSLADSRALIAKVEAGVKRAVVIGASFIGLEVAAALRARKVEVSVVAPEARPLENVLGAEAGDFVRTLHESHGVTFHLGEKVERIEAGRVTLGSGRTLEGDLVVLGVGVRPEVALAQKAGLAVEDGIVVNEFLETSAPGIYAVGDVARYLDKNTGKRQRVEHWVHAERQGQAAAANVLGAKRAFTVPPFFWSQHYDVQISYVGHAGRGAKAEVFGSLVGKDCAIAYREEGTITAVATIGRDLVSLKVEDALARGDRKRVEAVVRGEA
ncbi:MAG TPA: FAD-dependent oxidoreductase [Polyangiaceae bacterium]|jgi:NADPH-dependent 2,4-dienoyl-CoA reductase/sulfur reductase-like enzyme/nitrite reductase/ring-hydroxylating ferredoxin subunit